MGVPSLLQVVVGLLLALATVACARDSADKAVTVDEFIARIDRLDGQTVSVTGYLGECQGYSCRLYRNEAESADADRAMSDIRAALEEGATDVSGFPYPNHSAVSIGKGSDIFELRAYFYADSYVVITGKATNQCRSGVLACFDRAGDLEPIGIGSVPAPS